VLLPKEFCWSGVVSRDGDKVILEPMPAEKPPVDWKAFWAEIDALGGEDFPEVTDDDLRPDLDGALSFD